MDLTGQWADSLRSIERLFYLKMLAWGALTVLAGTTLLTLVRVRRVESGVLHGFGAVLAAAGAAELLLAIIARGSVALRDLPAAIALDRSLWFVVGLAAGMSLAGLAFAVGGWRLGRLGVVGAAVATLVHSAAAAILCLQLIAGLVR